jgi:predicted PurR-regulated permease PerM
MALEPEPRDSAPANLNTGPDWSRLRDISLTVLASLLVIAFLFWAAGHVIGTLLVIAISVLLSYGLLPLVRYLARLLPRWLAITIVYVACFSALSALVYLVVNTAVSQLVPLVSYLQAHTSDLQSFLSQFGISLNWQRLGAQLLSQARNVAGTLVPLLGDFAAVVIDIIVVTVLSIYFVANAPAVNRWMRASAPLDQRVRVTFILDTLNRVLGGYIRGQVTLATLVGLLVGLGMQLVFHLPFAVLLGVLAFVLEFIPFIGVIVSGVACVLVGLTVGPLTAVGVLLYFVGVHVVEAELVGPRIVGSAVGLHPAISLVGLIAGAELFGLWGALFAAPVAGIVQALVVAIYRTWRSGNPDQFPSAHLSGARHAKPATVPVAPNASTTDEGETGHGAANAKDTERRP